VAYKRPGTDISQACFEFLNYTVFLFSRKGGRAAAQHFTRLSPP